MKLVLDGESLTLDQLMQVAAATDIEIELDPVGLERMKLARQIVSRAVDNGETVYGLTTGLGSRSGDSLDRDTIAAFSMQTLRGRAHSIGPPLPIEVVRSAMLVRLNTLLTGGAGGDPAIADSLLACLHHRLTPVIGETGSVGVADLCWGAAMGLALCGEGEMFNANAERLPAEQVLSAAGIAPLVPGPKDGLVLASHSAFSAAMLALYVTAADTLLHSIQAATAVSMEAMRANLTPLDVIAAQLHPQAMQQESAEQLSSLLAGSTLFESGKAARLQDPLSIRNAVHIHAAAFAASWAAGDVATTEINSITDNPLVDLGSGRILSCGCYLTTHLVLAAQNLSQALAHTATAQLARISKLLSSRFSGLPQFLAHDDAGSNGFAPVMKIAEALVAEIHHAASPVSVWPSVNAEGVEDIQTHAPLAMKSLAGVLQQCESLCAIELMVAAQAADLRGLPGMAPGVIDIVQLTRRFSAALTEDRSLSADMTALADAVNRQVFARQAGSG